MSRIFALMLAAAAGLAILCAVGASAEQAERPAPAAAAAKSAEPAHAETRRLPADATTNHTITVDGRTLSFHATAGAIRLSSEAGAPEADVAYVAYQLDGADSSARPVTFAINGGPGAASAWLQLGAIGPWRLPMQNLSPSSAPALVDNQETWLAFTDLVFIDPPGTGYSRILAHGDEGEKTFWSVQGDIDALGAVIRRWLAEAKRTDSPKFIVGESYGGFRAPRLAERLATHEGVGVNGLVLISPALDMGALGVRPNDPFPYLTRLPSYAAAYRERKGPVTRADLADVERYAVGDYLSDWLRGPRDLAAVERMSARVAALTGLDPATVRRLGGRVDEEAFEREFDSPEGKVAAAYDATITAYDPDPEAEFSRALDPILPGYEAPFASAMKSLYARQLGWTSDERYEILNENVSRHWNWGRGLSPPNALWALRRMLALDPKFRVLISQGLTDLRTPYFATELELDQIPDYGAPGRLILKVRPGGHMHYARDDSRAALRDDARALIDGS
jgi:carboxypeptidase C (cathepsin A)